MNKNPIWKAVLIIFLVALAAWNVYPPKDKLKPGLDLAGGTSLVYDIDTTDMNPDERKGIAQRMIPFLLKRIDPTNVANIVMRPQGDTRIEIQLPLASADTLKKRKDDAMGQAALLAVVAQATLFDPEAVKDESKLEEWYRLSEMMRDSAGAIERAIAEGDFETITAKREELNKSCDDCHDAFGIDAD